MVYCMTFQTFNDYGVDWDGPCPNGEEPTETDIVVVPETESTLNQDELANLQGMIDPLRDSHYHGVDIHMEAVAFFEEHAQNTTTHS